MFLVICVFRSPNLQTAGSSAVQYVGDGYSALQQGIPQAAFLKDGAGAFLRGSQRVRVWGLGFRVRVRVGSNKNDNAVLMPLP